MVSERPDLDGLRLIQPGTPDVWLMFDGKRHRIASPAVYDALFSEIDRLVAFPEADSISMGEPIGEGSCLIRADGTLAIYLLTAFEGEARRGFVPTYESLRDFGFDEAKVRDVPMLLLNAIPVGPDLVSAGSRSGS